MEQFLALTMAIGTVGAVGVAVYTTQQGAPVLEAIDDVVGSDDEPEADSLDEVELPEPASSSRPEPTIPEADTPWVEPPLGPVDDLAKDGADYVPGPESESAWWANS